MFHKIQQNNKKILTLSNFYGQRKKHPLILGVFGTNYFSTVTLAPALGVVPSGNVLSVGLSQATKSQSG